MRLALWLVNDLFHAALGFSAGVVLCKLTSRERCCK